MDDERNPTDERTASVGEAALPAIEPTLVEQRSWKVIWTLALPVLGQSLLEMAVGWSDTILTGQILVSKEYISAITACNYLLWFYQSIGNVIGFGTQALVARAIGAQEPTTANRFVRQSLLLAMLLGVGLFVLEHLTSPLMAQLLNLSDASKPLAVRFLHTMGYGLPFVTIMHVGIVSLRSAGYTLAGMYIILLVNLVNIGCSWLLCIGWGPIPKLGWEGIALGTVISFVVGAVLVLIVLGRGHGKLKIGLPTFVPDVDAFRRLLRVGVPGVAGSMAIVVMQLWFLSLIGQLPDADTARAAHGVAIRCESISFLAAEAFCVAAAALVGQSLGAGKPQLAWYFGWTAFLHGAFFMTLTATIYYTNAPAMFALFVKSSETSVIEQGTSVLRLVAFAMPALAALIILSGALQGAGETRLPSIYNTVGLLFVRIPLTYYFIYDWPTLGLYGAWVAMVIDLYIRGGLALWAFVHGGWLKREI